MNKKCLGCGVLMQDINPNSLGYTPNLKNVYCQRCFRLKNYGEVKNISPLSEKEILQKINQKETLVFFLVDYLNINSYSINLFKQIKTSKVLVISKIDILRKEITHEALEKYLRKIYSLKEDIIFLSTKNNYNLNFLIKYLEDSQLSKAYICGLTNAGKSTLINALLKKYHINKEILISHNPNTTLDLINLKIDKYTLIDTPGFIYPNMSKKLLNKEIKPLTFNLKKATSIIINEDYTIYFLNPTSITLYLNNYDQVKRKYQPLKGSKLSILANQDIVLIGLGYISVKSSTDIILSNSKYVEIRESRSKF